MRAPTTSSPTHALHAGLSTPARHTPRRVAVSRRAGADGVHAADDCSYVN